MPLATIGDLEMDSVSLLQYMSTIDSETLGKTGNACICSTL